MLDFKDELEAELKTYLKAAVIKLMAVKKEAKRELEQTKEDCLAEINDYGQADLKTGVLLELKAIQTKH